MYFTKIHGTGNDFIIIDNTDGEIDPDKYRALACRLCQRRLSIGADGLMIVERPTMGGDLKMCFFNSDGSRGEMCGNGARCISRFGFERGFAKGDLVRIETDSGVVMGKQVDKRTYTVRLADPTVVQLYRTAKAGDEEFNCSYVELGNPGLPHAVFILDGWKDIPTEKLRKTGKKLRNYKGFPKGANVTFCSLSGPDHIEVITFERGVEDFTLACGTGCGAVVTALTLKGVVSGKDVLVSTPGGELRVTVSASQGQVTDIMLTGATCLVAEGEILDEDM